MSASTARERPEEMIESGPAGGVAAGGYLSTLMGASNLIITDVGGTSFEASLLEDGVGLVTDEYEIEWERPVITPMLDIRSIGAGGGSIAWIDDGGSLRVGPEERGRRPGPRVLRPRRQAADGHRRQPRARAHRPGAGRQARPRRRGGHRGRPHGGRAARAVGARLRRGHHADRQREHGDRDPHGLHRPRPRPARPHARRLRRGGRAARVRDRARGRHRQRARAAVRGRGVRVRGDDDGRPPRPRAHVLLAAGRDRHRRAQRSVQRPGGRGPRAALRPTTSRAATSRSSGPR